jgi:hypothetical protein
MINLFLGRLCERADFAAKNAMARVKKYLRLVRSLVQSCKNK